MIKVHGNNGTDFPDTNPLCCRTLEESLKSLWMGVTAKWLVTTHQSVGEMKTYKMMARLLKKVADEALVADDLGKGENCDRGVRDARGEDNQPRTSPSALEQQVDSNGSIFSPTGPLKPKSKGRLRIQLPRLGRRPTIGLKRPGEYILGCDENMVPHQHPCLTTAPSKGPRTISSTFP